MHTEPLRHLKTRTQQLPSTAERDKLAPQREQHALPELPIRCAACGHPLATPDDALTINGEHQHTFINPAGVVFEIRCFIRALGVSPVGASSDYWSWFPGYRWQLCNCGNCAIHIGWLFIAADDRFYGLICGALHDSGVHEAQR